MILKRDSNQSAAFHESAWRDHYLRFMNPPLLTRLLRNSVPVLENVQWKVLEVEEGSARTLLPLIRTSTNQHGTHQAALIALSADYTGGIALATLLTGVPFAGIHPSDEQESASLWLADMSVRFLAPSTGHLEGFCSVPENSFSKIRNRYASGRKVFITLPVEFSSNGELVAKAEMKYFVQPSKALQPGQKSERCPPIVATKLKASARMIAGVRAQTPNFPQIRIDCPHTKTAATEQGKLLADRLRLALPQLTDMVHARTQHGDSVLMSIPKLRQVIMLGAGLDMRPYRFFESHEEVTWFELDLPVMLEERQRIVSQLHNPPPVKRRPIGMDLRKDSVAELLLQHPDFDASLQTLVIYEGCSMYFDQETNADILRSSRQLLQHPDSRVWCDMVKSSALSDDARLEPVEDFLYGMKQLGEKFTYGNDAPRSLLEDCGFCQVDVTTTAEFLQIRDPVLDLYQFIVAS